MNQSHILLLFIFPEYDSEYFMPYTRDQLDEAKKDAENFHDMYPGVLYVKLVTVDALGYEEEVYQWTNPLSARLTRLVNPAGLAESISPMSSAFANPAGDFFQKLSKSFSDTALSLRPPSEAQFASPLSTTSKPYDDRRLRLIRRSRGRRR